LEDALSRADAPVLIPGATGEWPDFTHRRLLADHAGTVVRVVLEGGTRRGEAARETELALGDFFPSMRNGTLPAIAYSFFDLSGTAIPKAMPQLTHLCRRSKPAAVGGRLLMSVGSWGNGRPFHAHGPALFALLSGVKQWFVRRPGASLQWQLFDASRSELGRDDELAVGVRGPPVGLRPAAWGAPLRARPAASRHRAPGGREAVGLTFVSDESDE
jgi:hypothetical protein